MVSSAFGFTVPVSAVYGVPAAHRHSPQTIRSHSLKRTSRVEATQFLPSPGPTFSRGCQSRTDHELIGTDCGDAPSSSGWVPILEALSRSGFALNDTLPMRTELTNRMIGSTGRNKIARPRHTRRLNARRQLDYLGALSRTNRSTSLVSC